MGIRSRIFLIVFLLLTVSISITYVVAERDLTNTFKLQIVDELEKQANLLLISVDNLNKYSNTEEADREANNLGKASNSRVTFINNDGKVIGDSFLDVDQIALLDNHGDRIEVIDALLNGIGWSSRYSSTLNQDLLYFAIRDNQKVDPNIFPVIKFKNRLNEYPSTPIIINAANEVLVDQFLKKKIPFLSIYKIIMNILNDRNYKKYAIKTPININQILTIDNWAKNTTRKYVK